MSEPTIPAAEEPLSVGDRILDRYGVRERIAIGGHSVVYAGEDERLSRPVCIKVFYRASERDGVWQTSYEHFVQEAFALSKLTHPNTLRIYDFGYLPAPDEEEERGAPFQVSEFMNDGTLSRLVRVDGVRGADETADTIAALCGALSEAHNCGIIHRDIKPQNILFGKVGSGRTVKLADFGIAKSRASTDAELSFQANDTNVIAGRPLRMLSPSWAAPEQMSGDTIGPGTDIYSMGLIATFMLTGSVVFSTRDADEAYRLRVRGDELIDEAFAGLDLPASVPALIKQACSFVLEDRPTDIAWFGRELGQALRGSKPPAKAIDAAKRVVARAASPLPPPPVPPKLKNAPPAPPRRPQPRTSPPPPPGARRAAQLEPVPGPPPITTAPPNRAPRRITASEMDITVAGRACQFAPADEGVADVTVARGAGRLRLTLLPTQDRLCLHIKGLSCFVGVNDGRPSAAVQLYTDGVLHLVLPNQQRIASARVSFGNPAAGHTLFVIDGEPVALSVDDYPCAIAIDFGPQAECVFLFRPPAYTGQTTAPKRAWRRRKPTTRNS